MTQSASTPVPRTLVVETGDAAAYLARIGLTVPPIRGAAYRGEQSAIAVANSDFPRTGPGLERWIHTVGELRRTLRFRDWTSDDTDNRPVSISPDRSIRLGVMHGTSETGIASSEEGPKAYRRRGPATDSALAEQMALYMRADLLEQPIKYTLDGPVPPGNWFLMYHRGEDEIRMEVSLPRGIKNGQITGWAVRVMLDPYVFDAPVEVPTETGGDDVGFDVPEAL